jgi:hypothetical protein
MLDMLWTADAARKHGHGHDEPSSLAPAAPASNGSFLVQMPLSIIGSVLRRHTPSPSRGPSHADDAAPTSHAPEATTPQRLSMPALPDTPLASPAPSRPVSSGSSAAVDERPKKRSPRSKTSYLCARPARNADCPLTKLHLRPKVLLQLHQVIPSQRPKPTYEVIPFSLLPQRSTRRLARTFNTRERLGFNDLLVVKAEAYGNVQEGPTSDDEHWGSREVVGVICPAKSDKGVTEICMDDGASRWEVTEMPNGGFEFNTTNDHGLTLKARWVPKPAHSRRVSSMSASSQASPIVPPGQEDRKYTFSTISASSRRHPIIATMTRNRIDVMDSYSLPSATSPPTPGSLMHTHTPALTPTDIDADSFFRPEQMPNQTDDALRCFILVTGIWVSSNISQPSTPALENSSLARTLNHRAMSMSMLETPRSPSPTLTVDENHRSFPRLLRTGRERLPRSTSFTGPSPSLPQTPSTPKASPVPKTRSRRANSTGTADLHSMSGSMRKRYGFAFENQTVPESEEERQVKRSIEILRIKELALPISERSSYEAPLVEPTPLPTIIAIPPPITIPPTSPTSPTPLLSPPLLSPVQQDPERSRKTQSAYNPITTAGLWDSGVSERVGLKSRPTSLSVILDKQKKQDRKRERSKTKEDRKLEKDGANSVKKPGDWRRFKKGVRDLFRREKS